MDDHTQTSFGARLKLAMIQKGFSSNRSPYGVDVTHLSKITQHSPQICRKYLKNTVLPSFDTIRGSVEEPPKLGVLSDKK